MFPMRKFLGLCCAITAFWKFVNIPTGKHLVPRAGPQPPERLNQNAAKQRFCKNMDQQGARNCIVPLRLLGQQDDWQRQLMQIVQRGCRRMHSVFINHSAIRVFQKRGLDCRREQSVRINKYPLGLNDKFKRPPGHFILRDEQGYRNCVQFDHFR
jgi:hypothetical protein